MTTEAVLATLRHVWNNLEPMNLPMAVIGGVALATWKHVRFTQDVDILLSIGDTNVGGVIQRLGDAGIESRRANPLMRLEDAEFLQLIFEPPETFVEVQIDLLLARSEYQQTALERRVHVPSGELGFDFAVLSCEDLVIHKLLAGRIIDRADALALLRANRDTLDFDYLRRWIGKQNLEDAFNEIWKEAFPDASLPDIGGQTTE